MNAVQQLDYVRHQHVKRVTLVSYKCKIYSLTKLPLGNKRSWAEEKWFAGFLDVWHLFEFGDKTLKKQTKLNTSDSVSFVLTSKYVLPRAGYNFERLLECICKFCKGCFWNCFAL